MQSKSHCIRYQGATYNVRLLKKTELDILLEIDGKEYNILTQQLKAQQFKGEQAPVGVQENAPLMSASRVLAPLPGIVSRINVSKGQKIEKGDALLIIEAMKMENPVLAITAGKISQILVAQGSQVKTGQELLILDSIG